MYLIREICTRDMNNGDIYANHDNKLTIFSITHVHVYILRLCTLALYFALLQHACCYKLHVHVQSNL